MERLVYVCCWCDWQFPENGTLDPRKDYEYCPHCHGSYSFATPIALSFGAGI